MKPNNMILEQKIEKEKYKIRLKKLKRSKTELWYFD